jgi:hypothetical protein
VNHAEEKGIVALSDCSALPVTKTEESRIAFRQYDLLPLFGALSGRSFEAYKRKSFKSISDRLPG